MNEKNDLLDPSNSENTKLERRAKKDELLSLLAGEPDSSLATMRSQVVRLIYESYPSVEQFCIDKHMSKATLSNFLRGKKDFQVSTLNRISLACNRKLVIRLD